MCARLDEEMKGKGNCTLSEDMETEEGTVLEDVLEGTRMDEEVKCERILLEDEETTGENVLLENM